VEDILAILGIFVAFPIILFHYITKWKTAKTLTGSDEKLLDDLYELSRRLDDRMSTIERIMSAENPSWRHQLPSRDHELGLDRERLLSREDR
jgi:phage shock protein B